MNKFAEGQRVKVTFEGVFVCIDNDGDAIVKYKLGTGSGGGFQGYFEPASLEAVKEPIPDEPPSNSVVRVTRADGSFDVLSRIDSDQRPWYVNGRWYSWAELTQHEDVSQVEVLFDASKLEG